MAEVECIICGKIKHIRASDLFYTKTTSCVCQITKHNMSDSKIYSIYHNMKDRCYNENCHAYENYGGRGIKICDQWLEHEKGFQNFHKWSIENGYKEGLSIDRINVDEGYSPSNCQWVTLSENVTRANKINVRRKSNNGDYYGISPTGEYFTFNNANKFARNHNLNGGNIRDVANKRKKTHKGWTFGFVNEI